MLLQQASFFNGRTLLNVFVTFYILRLAVALVFLSEDIPPQPCSVSAMCLRSLRDVVLKYVTPKELKFWRYAVVSGQWL